ncbi:MAG: polyribonucleotide nucleotidyltransferase [Acidimicrobiia bacterium]|nr:polyribonucleotide nucleotidyltransferase [Acidimicrobiia bacterium]
MVSEHTVTGEIGGKQFSISTGKYAGLADGAVSVKLGETEMLVTAAANKSMRPGIDFFPLTVDIEERMYAVGKIPGSFFRREGRPSEEAILMCRLIDRPLRPSFADGFRCETHIVVTTLAVDEDNPFDVIALNGASAALSVSAIPFDGPIGAVRLGLKNGEWIPFPTHEDLEESVFELVVAGRRNDSGEIDVMMVEAGSTPHGLNLIEDGAAPSDEDAVARGLEEAREFIGQWIDLQTELTAQVEKPQIEWPLAVDYTDEILERVKTTATSKLASVISIEDKMERQYAENEALTETLAELGVDDDDEETTGQVKRAFKSVLKTLVRDRVVDDGVRLDGRGATDIRPLSAEVGVVGRAHGSGLFQRGDTQVLNLTTLGMLKMEQMLDTLGTDDAKRYMHHYNFPPYSVGEPGFMRGPKRREIGHGALAEKAVLPTVPDSDAFPYALRLVSEVLASNGSTSMASVCASSLSLMDAGVPIKEPVAGIAMGLIHRDGDFVTLTDILGAEDALGDMDFKVAGTADVITALQLDTKIQGLPAEVLAGALSQAKTARLNILKVMADAISEPRAEMNKWAPRIESIEIPKDKIGEVIGPKGAVIRELEEVTGATIEIDEEDGKGIVRVASTDSEQLADAKERITQIAFPPEAELGAEYEGEVVNITKFGAFVNILPGTDGLLHISKLDGSKRVERVEDYLSEGDTVKVKVGDKERGKVSLDLVEALPGATLPEPKGNRGGGGGGSRNGGGRDRGDRGGRGGDRGGRGGGRDGGRDGRNRDRSDDRKTDRSPQSGGGDGERRRPARSFEDALDELT